MSIVIAKGPRVANKTREQALESLQRNPAFPKNADVELEEVEGFWVAAWHEADFGGPPADDSEESSGPKSEGPDDTAPSPSDSESDSDSSDGPPSDSGDSDGPPKDKPKGGEKHEVQQLLQIVQQIAQALGIPDPTAQGAVPGEEGGLGGPEGGPPPGPPGAGGPPPGAGGPPHGHPGAGGPPGGPETIRHERSLKPGEAPPGTTPIGSPAFASTFEGHPWQAALDGGMATFETEERIPDDHTVAQVTSELQYLAEDTPVKVKQIKIETNDEGHRIARALISRY